MFTGVYDTFYVKIVKTNTLRDRSDSVPFMFKIKEKCPVIVHGIINAEKVYKNGTL